MGKCSHLSDEPHKGTYLSNMAKQNPPSATPQVAVLFYAATTSLELAVGTTTASTTTTTHPAVTLLDNTARTLALASVAWSKSAFACGLLGLRPVRTYRWVLLTMVGVLNAVVVGAAVFHWVRCRPISRAWDGGEGGFCFGVDARNGVQIAAQGELLCVYVCMCVCACLGFVCGSRRGERKKG